MREIIRVGGSVLVERNAGIGIGISDEHYHAAGAELVDTADELFSRAELIVKVKEPQPIECRRLREGQTLFTYLHLAPDPQQTRLLKESKVTAIAYETVTQNDGGLPLLTPMSQVAGRMSIQAGAHCLDFQFGSKVNTIYATAEALEHYVTLADLVIGAVLVPGASAPKLVTRAMVEGMRPGSVIVDVAIDQGGCFETSRPTTHQDPTYVTSGVVHYCVTNMPGAVPKTSTFALNNATLPFVLNLVTKGVKLALLDDVHLRNGLNLHLGMVTHEAVARDLGYDYVDAKEALFQ